MRRQRVAWTRKCDEVAATIKPLLDCYETEGDELALLNAFLHYAELPARHLTAVYGLHKVWGTCDVEFQDGREGYVLDMGEEEQSPAAQATPDRSPPWLNVDIQGADYTTTEGAARRAIYNANKSLHMDRPKRATNAVVSNGTAPRTKETADLLEGMHGQRTEVLELPKQTGPRASITVDACMERLKKAAGSKTNPIGFYGWSDDLFYHQRAQKEGTLMGQVARMQAHMGNADAPLAIMFLVAIGSLTALNKEDAEAAATRRGRGDKPKYRPVNGGPTILKTPLRCLMDLSSATKAKADLGPIQLGLGTPAGMECLVMLFRALVAAGFSPMTMDAVNAFNALKRKWMLRIWRQDGHLVFR